MFPSDLWNELRKRCSKVLPDLSDAATANVQLLLLKFYIIKNGWKVSTNRLVTTYVDMVSSSVMSYSSVVVPFTSPLTECSWSLSPVLPEFLTYRLPSHYCVLSLVIVIGLLYPVFIGAISVCFSLYWSWLDLLVLICDVGIPCSEIQIIIRRLIVNTRAPIDIFLYSSLHQF